VMVLSRLGLIAGGVAWVLGLVKPLLIGFALAFVLNRPCHFFFRLYDRGLSRTRARGAARPLAVVTSYLVLILAVLGATPLLRNGLVRLSQYPTAGKVLNALEPFTLFVLLLVMTGYLVDGSFNPFLYFRF
jgi:predicted PurR-regulated permease PerM